MTVVAAVAYYRLLAKPLFEEANFPRIACLRMVVWQNVQDKLLALYEQCVFHRDMLRILVNFLQIIGSFTRIDVNFPDQFRDLMNTFSISELSIKLPATACLLSSVSFYDTLLGYTLLPLVILVVMSFPTMYAKVCHPSKASNLFEHLGAHLHQSYLSKCVACCAHNITV